MITFQDFASLAVIGAFIAAVHAWAPIVAAIFGH